MSTILKSIPNPLIQCRACRLLGNLAKNYYEKIIENHSAVVAQALALILGETEDYQTKIMALRACRLLTRLDRFLDDLLRSNGLGLLMKMLVDLVSDDRKTDEPEPIEATGPKEDQRRERYFEEVARNLEGVRSDIFDIVVNDEKASKVPFVMPEDKNNLGILVEILKILQIISESQKNLLVKELNKNELGLKCVVSFADGKNPLRSYSLKILSNLSKNYMKTITILSSVSAIRAACELLTSTTLEKPLTSSETRHCINIICLLAGDACNRGKIRRSGSLRHLLFIAKTSDSMPEISLILFALNHFQYDNVSMDLLIKDGLVGFLVKELDSYLKSDDELKKKKCEDKVKILYKRKPDKKSINATKTKIPRLNLCEILELDSPDSSPSYSTSSPCSSRSMSPNSKSRHLYAMSSKTCNNESEAYSPVCSDEEEDVEEEESPTLFADENSKDLILEECFEKEPDDEQSNANMPDIVPNSALDVIENLLYRVTLLLSKNAELGKFQTMNTIIEAIKMFGSQTMFTNTLTNILS